MRLVRTFAMLAVACMLAGLAGCGGSPVTFAELPVHPELAPLERGTNSLADTMADTLEGSMGESVSAELKLYSVPAELSWEELDSFYATSLAEGDWKAADELRQESDALNTVGWTRGSLASEQGLVVGYGPPMLGDDAFLIVMLFSE